MNNEDNQHWLAARVAAITRTVMIGAVCAILPATAVMSQKLAPRFKVDGRVEIAAMHGSIPQDAMSEKANGVLYRGVRETNANISHC